MNKFIKPQYNKQNKSFRTIVESFFSLLLMYGLDLLLPLLLIPFLIRVIGIEKVGLLNFATAGIAYFSIVINYGFNLTATKEIALNVNNSKELGRIFNVVNSAKFLLTIGSGCVLVGLIWLLPQFSENFLLYFIVFSGVFFQNMFPVWFFQGIGNLKSVAILNSLIKLFFAGIVFYLVKDTDDFLIVAICNSAGYFFIAAFSFYYIKKKYNLQLSLSSFQEIQKQLRAGLYVFLSQVKISFFSNFNVVVLGFISGNIAVGYFSSADKIIRALAVVQIPVTAALFPHFSRLLKENKELAYAQIRKFSLYAIIIYIPILVILVIFAGEIVKVFFGEELKEVVILIRIMSPLPLFIILNNFSGTQMLLNMGRDKWFFNVLLSTAVLNVIMVIPLTRSFSYYGTALSVLISEFYLCVAMYLVYRKARISF